MDKVIEILNKTYEDGAPDAVLLARLKKCSKEELADFIAWSMNNKMMDKLFK